MQTRIFNEGDFVVCFLLMVFMVNAQQKVIKLYPGVAPGSESWTWQEKTRSDNKDNFKVTYNVVSPTLTVFSPEKSKGNGTGIVLCPGGGFHFLAIDWEGTDVARILASKGITVFLLKYRLVHSKNDNPFEGSEPQNQKAWDDESVPVIPLAVADGRAAIAYVRSHAKEYDLRSTRIGIMGFSAGGRVTASTAFNYSSENRPDFVAPIYGDMPESLQSFPVLPDAPPLFMACTQDDEFNFAPHAVSLYNKWYAAKRPVEMHLFVSGGHGFGVGNVANTTHKWLDTFEKWLRGVLKF